MGKPLILVSNDDGVTSRGIRVLVNIMEKLGEVVVVAPDKPQSGMGHAITIGETLRLEEEDIFANIKAYKCSGTPADCVKLAKHYILNERRNPNRNQERQNESNPNRNSHSHSDLHRLSYIRRSSIPRLNDMRKCKLTISIENDTFMSRLSYPKWWISHGSFKRFPNKLTPSVIYPYITTTFSKENLKFINICVVWINSTEI